MINIDGVTLNILLLIIGLSFGGMFGLGVSATGLLLIHLLKK